MSSGFPFSVTCWSFWHDFMSFSFMSLLFWGGHYQRFGFMANRWLRWMLLIPIVCVFSYILGDIDLERRLRRVGVSRGVDFFYTKGLVGLEERNSNGYPIG